MALTIYRADLILLEHVFFASREIGTLYETEPLIGNYALTYALGLCAAPYDWSGPPRYKQDLMPLNERGIYVTPATFKAGKLSYVFSQFNAQSDSYYFRFDQNAIATSARKARAANFPQAGKIRMLGLESEATFYILSDEEELSHLPSYIRLGKFNSKARVLWTRMQVHVTQPQAEEHEMTMFLNAVDLPPEHLAHLRGFTIYNIYPAPLLRRCRLSGPFWTTSLGSERIYLPAGMRYGVDAL